MEKETIKEYQWLWIPSEELKDFLENTNVNSMTVSSMIAYGLSTSINEGDDYDIYDEDNPVWLRTSELLILLENMNDLTHSMSYMDLQRRMVDLLYDEVEDHQNTQGHIVRKMYPFPAELENYDYRVGHFIEEYFSWFFEILKRFYNKEY